MPNTIVGASVGSDSLVGTSGDDIFKIEGANDTIAGNGGVDTLDFEDATVGVNVDLTAGIATGWGTQHFTGISQIYGGAGSDTLIGGATTTYINGGSGGNDKIVLGSQSTLVIGSNGNDTITGGAGNNDIVPGVGSNVIDGGSGYSTLDYRYMPGVVGVDLYAGGYHTGSHDTFNLSSDGKNHLVNIFANDAGDVIKADYQWNIIVGGAGADTLMGREGNDTITGGGGNDLIDGGTGQDVAVYSGPQAAYTITANAYGWVITDTRAGSPDGTDTVRNVEQLQFSDGLVQLGHPTATLDVGVLAAISNVLREDGHYDWSLSPSDNAAGSGSSNASALADYLSFKVSSGALTEAQAVAQVIVDARDTASVATLSYQFFTGSAPSAGGMDYLINPTGSNPNNLNADYYQAFNVENRFINFAVNLGSGQGAGAASFQTNYGSLSLSAAMSKAYDTIFGEVPTSAKVDTLLNTTFSIDGQTITRAQYFAIYGGQTDMGTKAAMVGWLLAEAVTSDLGTFALSNDAFLTDVATHNAAFGVDIIGHYNQPGFAYTG